MGTSAPADLLNFRNRFMTETGVSDPVEVGIVGDTAHAARGGYHISGDDINGTGNFSTDYSTRRSRDHFLPNPFASAIDLADNWPRGGRAAWLRFNNNVLWELMNTANMPTIRAINVSTNGTNQKRYDRANPGDGLIDSADTVTIHTHLEFWRDTEATAQRGTDLNRLIAHVKVARDGISLEEALGSPAPTSSMGETDMIFTVTSVPAGTKDMTGTAIPENGQCLATPGGAFNLTGSEFFSLPASAQAVRITIPWSRFAKLCWGMTQVAVTTVDTAAIVTAVTDAVNALDVLLTPDDVAAISTAAASAVEASTVAALQSTAGQAALVQADNTAEDS